MAKILFLIFFLVAVGNGPGSAQQLDIRTCRGAGSFWSFSNYMGYSISYNQKFKSGTRFGVGFSHFGNDNSYSWIHTSIYGDPGITKTFVEDRNPKNERYSAFYTIGWNPVKSQKAGIYWGPIVSLNWIHIFEQNHRFANEWFEDAIYYTEYWRPKRLGVGLFLEFEIKEIIFRQLSASMRLQSEWVGFNGFLSWDRSDPKTIIWNGADIGLKWNFDRLSNKK